MRKMNILIMAVVIGLAIGWSTIPSSQAASFQSFGVLPAPFNGSFTYGISPDGSVAVGSMFNSNPLPPYVGKEAAFNTPGGSITGLGYLPGGSSGGIAYDASSGGAVIVGNSDIASQSPIPTSQAFRWTAQGGMVGLGTLPGQFSNSARGVSSDGTVVVGYARIASSDQAFCWTAQSGTMVSLGTLAGDTNSEAYGVSGDGSVIVGTSFGIPGSHAFRWTQAGGMTALTVPGGINDNSKALAVSSDGGTIVGSASYSIGWEGGDYACRWTAAGWADLQAGHPYPSRALAVSGDGSVIVGRVGSHGLGMAEPYIPPTAFIWDTQHGSRDLKTVLSTDYGLNLTGWTLREAKGISDDGHTIVGNGIDPQGNPEGWIAVIPEPAAVWLIMVSVLGVFHRRSFFPKG